MTIRDKLKGIVNGKMRYIYYKKKGQEFGFQAVGYNLVEKMEMCISLLSAGVVSVKADLVLRDKDSETEESIGSNQKE